MKTIISAVYCVLLCTMLIFVAGCDGVETPPADNLDDSTEKTKDPVKEPSIFEGIYKGIFSVTYSVKPFPGFERQETGGVTVTLEDGKFLCTGNANRIPVGGQGSYSISGNKIVFVSEGFYTADFDWNLILNGTYEYTLEGDKLTFGANKNDVGYYEYALVKE